MSSFSTRPARPNSEKPFQKLCQSASSPTGRDLYLRGPKGCGKTTLLRDFAAHLRQNLADYPISVVVEWDLKRDTPLNDGDFRLQMGRKLAEALADSPHKEHQELAEALKSKEEFLSDIQTAFSYLDRPAAFIIDNHDAVLSVGDVSVGMWGQLNELLEAYDGHKKLRIFASSRESLQELARDEEERTSPYISRLQVVPVRPFDTEDLVLCLRPLEASQIELDETARRELLHWTGGAPALVASVLEAIAQQGARTWDATQISDLSRSLKESVEHILIKQWHSASIEIRSAFVALCQEKTEVDPEPTLPNVLEEMVRRGWVIESENGLMPTHFAASYALLYGTKSGQLPALFGKPSDWETHFPEVMKLRVSQIRNADTDLKNRVLKSIDCLLIEDDPRKSLEEMRNIVLRALELVWKAESVEVPEPGRTRILPEDWVSRAERAKIYGFPTDAGPQVSLLRALMTGFHEDRECLVRYPSKSTYELINTLNGAGNFYYHNSGHATHYGFAATLCLSAVELCDALARELENDR